MPTDLPPDYKPQPGKPDPGTGKGVPEPPTGGEDVKGYTPPGAKPGRKGGLPGGDGDVVDPTVWKGPGAAETDPAGVPTPAGTPTF